MGVAGSKAPRYRRIGATGMLAHGLTPILNVSDLGQSIAWFKKLGLGAGVGVG